MSTNKKQTQMEGEKTKILYTADKLFRDLRPDEDEKRIKYKVLRRVSVFYLRALSLNKHAFMQKE